MRNTRFLFINALLAIGLLAGCREVEQVGPSASSGTTPSRFAVMTIPAGTSVAITMATPLTSETDRVGATWTGMTHSPAVFDGQIVIPEGSSVSGTVTSVRPARKGHLAMLDLAMDVITVDGRAYEVSGRMESIVAGSARARRVDATADRDDSGAGARTAASDSLLRIVIEGKAVARVRAERKGAEVVIREGTALMFTTNEPIAVRL